jgi:D-3-phosphoglycerate dehydrogenase
MNVVAYDPFQKEWIDGVMRAASLNEMLPDADVVSVHVPLSKETTHLVGRAEFAAMKRGAVVLNTSRGAILDEAALVESLESGHLGGAALDVIHDEYSSENNLRERLLNYARTHENLLITPHLGGATHDSLEKVEIFMAEKLVRHLQSTRQSTR